jgi:hypothetical protein
MMQKKRPKAIVHNSLGLNALCQRIEDFPACGVLELGPVRKGNIEFWSQVTPTIHVADLRSDLPLPRLPEDPDDPEPPKRAWHQVLRLPKERRFDIILVWDLLNYLSIRDVSDLIEYLCEFCRPGTVLFALIFDNPEMPQDITVYHIVDESHLGYEISTSAVKECPRHQPHALTQIMRQFRISNSFRLRNGVIEYIFTYEGNSLA